MHRLVKPFLGAWCDRRSFKEVFLVTLIVAIGGNLIYAMARFFKRWELLLAGRLLSGAGCANSALSYAYVSRTVEPDSRSGSLAKISLAFPLGMVMGPAFNAITGALNITIGGFMINAGNSPGLLIAALMVVELFLLISFLPEPPPYERAAPPSAAADTADGVETGCGASSTSEHTSKMRSFLLELVSLQSAACFLTVFTFNFAIGASEALVTPITRAAFHWTPLQVCIRRLKLEGWNSCLFVPRVPCPLAPAHCCILPSHPEFVHFPGYIIDYDRIQLDSNAPVALSARAAA